MTAFDDNLKDNEAFIFELDDVLYPEKDYLLQVYYLFAQFLAYTEQVDGEEMVKFMQEAYQNDGATDIFRKTAIRFNLDNKYQFNFDLLHQNARLPLKLLLFAPVLTFLQQIILQGKKLFLLAAGDPVAQLNKIRQIEWNGVEQQLVVYFTEEIAKGSTAGAIIEIMGRHGLNDDKVMFIGKGDDIVNKAFSNNIKFLPIAKLLLP